MTAGCCVRDDKLRQPKDRAEMRQLQRLPGNQIEASSANPAYASFRFGIGDTGVVVIGRVVWVGREV